MATISGYPVRQSVTLTDRIFIASGGAETIDSATLAQVIGLVPAPANSNSGGGPALAPGYGRAYIPGTGWNRPALSSLTWYNQGSAVATDVAGGPIHLTQNQVSASNAWSILGLAVDDTKPFTVDMMLEIDGYGGAHGGLIVGDSATGNFLSFDLYSGNAQFYNTEWTGLSTTGSVVTGYSGNQNNRALAGSPTQVWLRVKFSGSLPGSISFLTSYNPLDDASWLAFESYSVGGSNFLAGIDTVGFGVCNGSAATPAVINLWGLFHTSP